MSSLANKPNQLTPIVILDITFAGYDIIRSLRKYKIPMYAFSYKNTGIEVRTKQVKKIFIYKSEDNLLDLLLKLAGTFNSKPILYITNDHRVEFIIKNYETICHHYLVNLPPPELLTTLLDKAKFSTFAPIHGLLSPKTLAIKTYDDYKLIQEFNFPIIVKPIVKTAAWHEHDMPKAITFYNVDEFNAEYEKLYNIQSDLLIQEFIEGDESDLYFCHAYFNQQGKVVSTFTGRKVRQWKPVTGTASTLQPVSIPQIENTTIDFYSRINYKGFGSLEFKYNKTRDKYYVIEPTVGRYDLYVHFSTVGGVNLPLLHYCELSKTQIKPTEKLNNNYTYINEISEMQSAIHALKTKQITFGQLIRSYKGKLFFHYTSLSEPQISYKVLYIVSRYLSGQLVRYLLQTIRNKRK